MIHRLRRVSAAAVLLLAFLAQDARSQTQMQFPTTPWGAFAPSRVTCGILKAANFNATTDQSIPISFPSVSYMIDAIQIGNPSTSLTTAAGGFYTAASKAGIAIVANSQAYSSLTTNTANTAGNAMLATIASDGAISALTLRTLYFSLTTAQGAAATADIRIYCRPLYGP